VSARGDAGEARERAAGILDQLARWSARHVETLVRQCEARQELGSDTRFTKRAGTAVVTCTPRSGYPSVSVSVPWT